MFNKLALTVGVLATVVGFGQFVAPARVEAQEQQLFTYFCHRTNSLTNPYVSLPMSSPYSEIDGINGQGEGNGDHRSNPAHQGPVFDPQVNDKDNKVWGDIIPPIAGGPGLTPSGYNWTQEGMAIYYNDCNLDGEDPAPADISFQVACSADGTLVEVTITNDGDLEGYVEINGEDHTIAGGASETFTYPVGENIEIYIVYPQSERSELVYDETPVCPTEEDPEDPETPVVVATGGDNPTVLATADLPNTAGANTAAVLSAVSAAAVVLSLASKKLYAKFF